MSRPQPRPAVRKGQKARVGLAGPSGSGKTWTALEAATVLAQGGPILVIDTERGSASLYADYFTFDVIEWEPPYNPREFAACITEHAPGYAVIVGDSLSHFWEAEGGTRDIVDAAAARARGNSFAGWKEGTPAQNDMYAALLRAPCHVIVTMRSKTEYVLEDRNGKQVPRKIGMAPIQRQGIEYEFTVTADLDYEHTLLIDKTRCHPLAGAMFKMGHTAEMAETLRDWLGTAEAMADAETVAAIVAMFDQIADDAARKTAKDMFVELFGMPQYLTANQAAEAQGWLAERLTHEDTTEKGAGVDGPVGDGDAALSGDGADGQDVGRSVPEPAPARQGKGAGSALHGSAPNPTQRKAGRAAANGARPAPDATQVPAGGDIVAELDHEYSQLGQVQRAAFDAWSTRAGLPESRADASRAQVLAAIEKARELRSHTGPIDTCDEAEAVQS